jgi:hypothetical protein
MSNTTTYRTPTEDILTKGLHQMTIACESLTKQNEILNNDVEKLKSKLTNRGLVRLFFMMLVHVYVCYST